MTYNKWVSQRDLFPLNQPLVIEHNIKLLKEYYTKHQHNYYKDIVNTHLTPIHNKYSRYITPPTILPQTQISITECNQ